MEAIDVLKNLVEAFYKQSPRPKTSIAFKMKMIASVDYLKSQGVELPAYDSAKFNNVDGKKWKPEDDGMGGNAC